MVRVNETDPFEAISLSWIDEDGSIEQGLLNEYELDRPKWFFLEFGRRMRGAFAGDSDEIRRVKRGCGQSERLAVLKWKS